MSGANFAQAIDEKLSPSVSLPVWFPFYYYETLHEVVDDLATCQTNTTDSGLSSEEKDKLNNEILPELEVLDLIEARDFLPAYYANTGLLYSKGGLIYKLLNDIEPSEKLQALAERYTENQDFNYSDEDGYKLPAASVDLLLEAKSELESAIDTLNTPPGP